VQAGISLGAALVKKSLPLNPPAGFFRSGPPQIRCSPEVVQTLQVEVESTVSSVNGRGARGRPFGFGPGNKGRPRGALNRKTRLLAALLEGEQEELIRKGLEVAAGGDSQMLKFFLSRILPHERFVVIDLPRMESADDAVEALAAVTSAVCEAKITPSEAANLAALVNSYARAIDIADLVKRMEALEARMSGTARHVSDSI